jgi:hypothetical protein
MFAALSSFAPRRHFSRGRYAGAGVAKRFYREAGWDVLIHIKELTSKLFGKSRILLCVLKHYAADYANEARSL